MASWGPEARVMSADTYPMMPVPFRGFATPHNTSSPSGPRDDSQDISTMRRTEDLENSHERTALFQSGEDQQATGSQSASTAEAAHRS